MPDFDVKIRVDLTVCVTADNAERAEWAMRHSFDHRHANDPLAGLKFNVRSAPEIQAAIMTCVFHPDDDVTVRPC